MLEGVEGVPPETVIPLKELIVVDPFLNVTVCGEEQLKVMKP